MSGHGGYRPGAGRPKGALNKDNRDIREMILGALVTVGGKDYLARQAEQNPAAFMTLVGKVLPTQITGENGAALNWVIRIPAEPSSAEEWFLQYAPKHIQDARKVVAGETITSTAVEVNGAAEPNPGTPSGTPEDEPPESHSLPPLRGR